MFSKLLSWLRTLNLFGSSLTANNEYELKNERISTRTFIIISIVCIFVILIYTSQVSRQHTKEVTNPSYNLFQSLSLRYPQTLRCPCNNIAIAHKSFIHLDPQFHQICSSDFITQNWIDHVGSVRDTYISEDFSYVAALIFLTLASFCRHANETIMIALQTFNSTSFITAEALSKSVFIDQIHEITSTFQSSTELNYYQSFNLMQFSIQTNSPLSGLFSNIRIQYYPATTAFIVTPRQYENGTCSCSISSSCIAPLILKNRQINQSNTSSFIPIPGLYTGCYLTEAIRRSSLECFYRTSCITIIEQFLQAPLIFNKSILPLNSSVTSRFKISSTIDQLLSKVMTEKWKENVNHVEYFRQCEVLSCTYSFISKFNILYMITTLISLIGGLTKVLQIVIPRIVKFIRCRLVPPPIVANESDAGPRSWRERLYKINYFSNPSLRLNEEQIKQQIISTWIFFLLLLITFIVLVSYHSIVLVTRVHQIEFPTIEQFIRLQTDKFSNSSLFCPCSRVVIPYEKFFHINYTLHPLCSSYFVQKKWINHPPPSQIYNERYDFRLVHGTFFNALASFCQASIDHIDTSLTSFNKTLFITDKPLTQEAFIMEVNSTFMKFKTSIIRSFMRDITLISNMTRMNGLISTQETNFGYRFQFFGSSSTFIYYYVPHFIFPGNMFRVCRCYPTTQCYIPLAIYDSQISISPDDVIPGLYFNCLPIDGIRYSTLSCLFDQVCVDRMSFWLQAPNMKAIDSNKLIRFYTNSTVSEIENELFVDEWSYSVSYRTFYEICHPNHCTYTLDQHNSFWIILTIVLGLIGGLMKIFQVIVPRFVQSIFFIYSRCCHRVQRDITSTSASSIFSIRSIVQRLRQFNLFHTDNNINPNNEFEIRCEIISTRLYLLFLFLSLIILTIYSSQVQLTKTIVINNPSIENYTLLYNNHPQTLICPCKNISIYQETFLFIQPNFHQICQSDFIDFRWINGFSHAAAEQHFHVRDFRGLGDAIFGTIASFCQLSFSLINNKHFDFNRTSFFTYQIIPSNQLAKQGQSIIDLFISTTKNTFINSLQSIRDTTHANSFVTFYSSSTSFIPIIDNEEDIKLMSRSKLYNISSTLSCSCYTDPTCIELAGLYNSSNDKLIDVIPGFFIGCYITEATLQSNLISLYNQTWIDDFRNKIKFDYINPIPFYTKALNASLNTQFNVTTPINNMMINMMIESWYNHVNYSAYFEHCHPIECKYTYIVKYDMVYIITTLIGLIGGLDTILRLIIPRVVKLIRRCWFKRCHHRQIQVISDTIDTLPQ